MAFEIYNDSRAAPNETLTASATLTAEKIIGLQGEESGVRAVAGFFQGR